MKAVIPVAGNGTRMYPLGVTTPKCLIPILNKPLIIWTLENLAVNDIREVVLVVSAGKLGQKIRDFFAKEFKQYSKVADMKIEFAVQEQQLGTAHVLQMAKDYFQAGEEFIFLYGDDLYGPQNIAQLLTFEGLVLAGLEVTDPEKWGIFQVDDQNNLVKLIEKPTEPVGNLANIGCMKLSAGIFDTFDSLEISPRGEYELTDSLTILAKKHPIKVVTAPDYWLPIGYPWHILDAADHFLPEIEHDIEGTVEDNVVIDGKVNLPKSSIIKQGSRIEGNVQIGENVEIGPYAYIRGNTAIGDNSKIGFTVEVKDSVIGNYTKLHNMIYVGSSIIGNHVNVAVGTIITNRRHDKKNVATPIKGKMTDTGRRKFGAVIGDNVSLGAATRIYPGRKIWPGKTTVPGEIVTKDLIE